MLAPMPGAGRRPPAPAAVAGALVVGLAAALSGCAGIGQPAPYDSPGINGLVIPTPRADPADFVTEVDNPWLALEAGSRRHYDVTADGRSLGTIDVEVLDGTTEVAGLSATAVRTTSEIGGEADDETRLYAQDEAGNVWLVGVDSTGVAWRAGEDGAEAGLAMPADPRLGDGWLTFRVPDVPEGSTTVEDQSRHLVQTRETEGGAVDTTTRNVYESGVGLVSVEDVTDGWQAVLADQA